MVWSGTQALSWDAQPLSTVYSYSPATNAWTSTLISGLAPGSTYHATTCWDGREVLFFAPGGQGNEMSQFDPSTVQWTRTFTVNATNAPERLDLGRLRMDCAFFRWRMEGREGVGRYDVVQKM